MAIGLKLDQIKTIPGILKILEIALLFLAAVCSGAFSNGERSYGSKTEKVDSNNVEFLVAMSVIALVFAVVAFVLLLLGISESIRLPRKGYVIGIVHGTLALLLLIAASVAAGEKFYCSNVDYSPSCGVLRASIAFGYFATLALIADMVFYVYSEWKGSAPGGGGRAASSPEKMPQGNQSDPYIA